MLQFKVDNYGIDREKRQLSTILHMNQRPGRICTTKKAPHLRCFHCSAIQLPAANSLWKSSGFLSFMVCGSRRQYFVFAPHQVFAFSFCILLLFYLHRHLTWELPRSPNKKCISNEMHFLFSNFLSSQAHHRPGCLSYGKSNGFPFYNDLQPAETILCFRAKYFGVCA